MKTKPIILTASNPKSALYHIEAEQKRRNGELAEYAWQTKDGTTVLLREITDKHLANTINMLKRNIFNPIYEKIVKGEQQDDNWINF